VKLPAEDPERLFQHIYAGDVCGSLEEYLKAFDVTLSVMQTEESLYRTAYELAEDCSKENVRYIEVRYSPMLHTQRGLRLAEIVEAVIQGLRQGERDFGVRAGVILCGIRSINPESSLRMAELCVAFKNRGVIGFDLAGAEYNFPAKDHQQAFQLILDNNVNCTAHAGEAYGPESIAQAIHYCGAHRIGHGTRLRENGDLLNYVNDHRIPLEVCLSSNIQTGAAPDLASHPLPFFYSYGLRVTINTDNRLVTNTTVSKELHLVHRTYGLELDDLKELIVDGWKSTFMPYREKADMLKKITRELELFTGDEARDAELRGGAGTTARLSPSNTER
jgi:adenosine deaminase